MSGLLVVETALLFASTTAWALGEAGAVRLYKNGSDNWELDRDDEMDSSGGALYKQVAGCKSVWMNPGDYVDLRVYQATGGALALYGSGVNCWMSAYFLVDRVG